MEQHGLINFLMTAQPINNFPLRGGAVAKTLIFGPHMMKLIADKFLIFFIMKADLIPLLNVQMDHLAAIECSSEAVRAKTSL